MQKPIEFSWCSIVNRSPLIVVLFLAAWTFSQEKGKNKTTVGPEFAKAANAAFVAIRNSAHSSKDVVDLAPDQTVQAAINKADEAASSAPETSVIQQIKFLAILRPIELGTYDLSPSEAALAKLDQTGNCITAWRKALQDLSGDQPKECTLNDKK